MLEAHDFLLKMSGAVGFGVYIDSLMFYPKIVDADKIMK